MKVSIIGVGNVGSATCYLLSLRNICSQIVLIDKKYEISSGKATDIMQSAASLNMATQIKSTGDYSQIKNSDVVVITAGSPRKPGMSREDLLQINIDIMKDVTKNIKEYAPNSKIVVVSNPLDILTYVALKVSGFDKSKVIGMGGILDSARMSNYIVEKLQYGYGQVNSMVIGAHGEKMLPLTRFSSVAGIGINTILNEKECEEICYNTKNGGALIVEKLGTSAYYAPASSICVLIEAILKDTKTLHSCSVLLEGEYGINDVCVGVPIVIGKNGIKRIVELPLNEKEQLALEDSAKSLKEMVEIAKTMY
ncbi:MAG: malate dehydrogenase [Campylobacteraceae bacterium]